MASNADASTALDSGRSHSNQQTVVFRMVDESFGIDQRSIRTFVDVAVQDAVIKSLSRYCGEKMVISGAAICSDVNVAHIANVNGVMSAA